MLISGLAKVGFTILLWLDSVIYAFIAWVYRVFLLLAQANIFSGKDYQTLVSRLYAIIGVVMLFVLAYSLLKAIVNPDEFTKGDTSPGKFAMNVVMTIIIIALVPTVFNYAFKIQNAILNDNVIGKIILGMQTNPDDKSTKSNDIIIQAGTQMAGTVLSAFITPATVQENTDLDIDNRKKYGNDMQFYYYDNTGAEQVKTVPKNEWCLSATIDKTDSTGECEYGLMENIASFGRFNRIVRLSKPIDEDALDYQLLISTAAGCFLLYVLASFCFDLGIRVVKLALYQIIAPVPAIARILPGKKGEGIFNNWVKVTLTTFMEVFIRIAAMYFGVYLIDVFIEAWSKGNVFGNIDTSLGSGLFMPAMLAKIFIILGIVACIKMIPKLISDITGMDGNMKLGIKDKLAAGGVFAGGAMAGAGITSAVRNGRNAIDNVKNADGKWNKFKAAARGTGSVVAGATSGAARAARRNPQSYGDMRTAAETSALETEVARDSRESRRAEDKAEMHNKGFDNLRDDGIKAYIAARSGIIKDNISDSWDRFSAGGSLESYKQQAAVYDAMLAETKAVKESSENLPNTKKGMFRMGTVTDSDGNVLIHANDNLTLSQTEKLISQLSTSGNLQQALQAEAIERAMKKQIKDISKAMQTISMMEVGSADRQTAVNNFNNTYLTQEAADQNETLKDSKGNILKDSSGNDITISGVEVIGKVELAQIASSMDSLKDAIVRNSANLESNGVNLEGVIQNGTVQVDKMGELTDQLKLNKAQNEASMKKAEARQKKNEKPKN